MGDGQARHTGVAAAGVDERGEPTCSFPAAHPLAGRSGFCKDLRRRESPSRLSGLRAKCLTLW